MSTGSVCTVKDCKAAPPPHGFMCKHHWARVPESLKVKIWSSSISHHRYIMATFAEWARLHQEYVAMARATVEALEEIEAEEAV